VGSWVPLSEEFCRLAFHGREAELAGGGVGVPSQLAGGVEVVGLAAGEAQAGPLEPGPGQPGGAPSRWWMAAAASNRSSASS
jgi:hypothetical protein